MVSENNLAQGGEVDGIRPSMEGRMVRTDRYKYCLYAHGQRREALYDLQNDPLETVNLAGDPQYHQVLAEHRDFLREFGKTQNDTLVKELVADDVGPRPFAKHITTRGG